MSDTNQGRASRAARAAAMTAEDAAVEAVREFPASFTALFDKTLARAKDAHEKMTTIMEHSTEAFEEAFSCANRGSAEYRAKVMDIARANANSAFDLARDVLAAKSVPEMLERTAAHQRKQFELFSQQIKELSQLTQKVVTETAEPIRSGMSEPFRMAS
jgi:phasin